VTGHDEYVRHGVNGVVVDFDDVPGTAGWIDLLARDRALLERLGRGALDTAGAWPSWKRSTAAFATALEEIAESPAPAAGAGAARLLADLDAAMEEQRMAQRREARAAEAAERHLAAALQELERTRARLAAVEATRVWRARETLHRLRTRRLR
jgi:glycosyltransferase involved in cell wall biosynthesis